MLKPKLQLDKFENEASEYNTKSLYVIFNVISVNEFCRVSTCTLIKDDWDNLQGTQEWTNMIKVSELQKLTTTFESLGMK